MLPRAMYAVLLSISLAGIMVQVDAFLLPKDEPKQYLQHTYENTAGGQWNPPPFYCGQLPPTGCSKDSRICRDYCRAQGGGLPICLDDKCTCRNEWWRGLIGPILD